MALEYGEDKGTGRIGAAAAEKGTDSPYMRLRASTSRWGDS
jgi:hypothetical protein